MSLDDVAEMLGAKETPQDRDEWEALIDAHAGKYMKSGAATAAYWRNQYEQLKSKTGAVA